ncbi:ESCRT-II complex vps25 subunit [Lentinula edodes]|uniref:ESCRT-II complex vps25 subunit n=1 Tax=Lentinula edodes TaxID=5353 RepID=A0A1Q3EM53_LENED|nr:ESCRT-II complex vps25 subunit [Lentinula edodes]
MPVLSGVKAIAKLRDLGRRDFVVGVTGNALVSDQREYLDAGVDHVLTKPVLERRFLLPSIHSAPPFFTSVFLSIATEQWIQIILKYSRHRRLFTIRVEDSETTGHDWDEVLRNERINRSSFVLILHPCADGVPETCSKSYTNGYHQPDT